MKLPKNRRAFALVLVLIALVISSSMAVFFLTSVARERLGVNLYASGGEVHHLAGMPVSQVIGHINAATREGMDPTTGKRANPVSWASQPGMVRTYDSSGGASKVYKLYSWDNMVQAGAGFDPSSPAQTPPVDWRKETAHYTDINQPVNDVYPIVDPRAEGKVAGFSVNEGDPVVGGADKENAPMPVKWLYVLEDGQMVAPSSGSGNLANIPGAGTGNAIIGRVAFWTDDETSKVNINTASEGSYWDAPHSGSRDDIQLAGNPPTKNEYQRTPGHPGMTSLSAVFPEMVSENATDPTQTRWGGSYATQVEKIYNMVPRLAWGKAGGPYLGSQGGRYPVPQYTYNYEPARDSIPVASLPRPVVLDTDRLYVIADDVWFQPLLAGAGLSRSANAAFDDNLATSDFQKRLFFLTANSRAPETTLFETPRISLWPITWPNASSYFPARMSRIPSLPAKYKTPTTFNDPIADINSVWITAEERLLAYCGTLNTANASGGDRYYFQRKDPDSPVNDWDNAAFPVYSKRNRDLVAYLTRQMAKPVPGYGSSLQDSWGGVEAANWAGLNTLNYIRSQVNQFTAPTAVEGVRYSFTGVSFRNGNIGTKSTGAAGIEEPNAKVATPLRTSINNKEYHPVGTYPALEEVALVFYAAKRNEPVPPPLSDPLLAPDNVLYPEWRNPFNWQNLINLTDPTYPGGISTQTTVMRAVMLLEFSGLEPGVSVKPTFWVKVKGSSFRVNGGAIGLPTTTGLVSQCVLSSVSTYSTSLNPLLDNNDVAKIFSNSAAPAANVWQLSSNDISVNPTDRTFSFSGSPITLEFYACDPAGVDTNPTGDPNRKIYEKTIDFRKWDGSSYPTPLAPRWSMASRAYRFNDDGSENTTSTGGKLPGGGYSKAQTVPPAAPVPTAVANMSKFKRTIDPLVTPEFPNRYDLWQPNPGYSGIPGAPPGLNTAWAWAEFAPSITKLGTATITDVRSSNSVYQWRQNNHGYAYRGRVAGYSSSANDPDDARETGISTHNISTNFRKRVEATDQRNTATRPAFCEEGFNAQAPTDFKNPNTYPPVPDIYSGPYSADLFMHSTETPLKENNPLITPYDTVFSMINKSPNPSGDDRDPRLAIVSGNADFYSDDFDNIKTVMGAGKNPATVVDPLYPRTTVQAQWHQFGTPGQVPSGTGYRILPSYNNRPFARSASFATTADFGSTIPLEAGYQNKVPLTGDWTGMPGRYPDGGLLVRPDQEYAQLAQDTSGAMYVPYYPRITYGSYTGGPVTSASDELSYFSPNRQIPSPVILGTLPRTMTSHWQTLAFSPNPSNTLHPGLAKARPTAPDHLFLDLLWMPVAEPYPISEQLSTAGKVNLNYRMMPFSYIERKTALYAAMKSTWVTAVVESDNNAAYYKSHGMVRDKPDSKTRYSIDVAETLKAFDQIFTAGDLFRSASQLCEMFLVPKGQTLSTLATFWITNRLTPDNVREQPYNDLYSRVTTKSNTFTVHWRVQSLRKNPGTDPAVWDESRDRRISELRGSTLIERYIDPNTKDDPATISVNEGIPDYATDPDPAPLSHYYKWRVVSENYFQP